jgi:hypothetical protein
VARPARVMTSRSHSASTRFAVNGARQLARCSCRRECARPAGCCETRCGRVAGAGWWTRAKGTVPTSTATASGPESCSHGRVRAGNHGTTDHDQGKPDAGTAARTGVELAAAAAARAQAASAARARSSGRLRHAAAADGKLLAQRNTHCPSLANRASESCEIRVLCAKKRLNEVESIRTSRGSTNYQLQPPNYRTTPQ